MEQNPEFIEHIFRVTLEVYDDTLANTVQYVIDECVVRVPADQVPSDDDIFEAARRIWMQGTGLIEGDTHYLSLLSWDSPQKTHHVAGSLESDRGQRIADYEYRFRGYPFEEMCENIILPGHHFYFEDMSMAHPSNDFRALYPIRVTYVARINHDKTFTVYVGSSGSAQNIAERGQKITSSAVESLFKQLIDHGFKPAY